MKIRDVAKAAGVSIATVSRVINHPEQVTGETRERVQAIIAQHNYIPNGEAKAPRRSKKKNSIAVIVTNPHAYRNIADGIGSVCIKKKYTVQIVEGIDEKSILSILKDVIIQQTDATILSAELLTPPVQKILKDEHMPFVGIGGDERDGNISRCYINYRDTAAQMAELLALKREGDALLMLCDWKDSCGRQMKEGFENAWRGKVAVRYVGNNPEDGYMHMQDVLAIGKHPDAVFAQTDDIAAGVLKAAAEAKIAVPTDMKVAGFDNSPFSAFLTPELTTVEQPTGRLGMLAARMLFDALEDEDYFDIETRAIALKGRLKIRQSCGNQKAIYQEYE